jgi:hypothetical protein
LLEKDYEGGKMGFALVIATLEYKAQDANDRKEKNDEGVNKKLVHLKRTMKSTSQISLQSL